jgi:predicted RNase H-like HicB family nuclease
VFGFSSTTGLAPPTTLVMLNLPSMTLYSYPITVEREGKRYCAYSDDFPGVYGLGKSIEQAKKSILQAMHLYIAHCRKKGKPVPVTPSVYAETVTLALD